MMKINITHAMLAPLLLSLGYASVSAPLIMYEIVMTPSAIRNSFRRPSLPVNTQLIIHDTNWMELDMRLRFMPPSATREAKTVKLEDTEVEQGMLTTQLRKCHDSNAIRESFPHRRVFQEVHVGESLVVALIFESQDNLPELLLNLRVILRKTADPSEQFPRFVKLVGGFLCFPTGRFWD